MHPTYRGRFAPSPTGPLHFGSLIAAFASFLEARQQQGQWLLRIDDLDQTRCIAGMDSHILRTLESMGLEWDGEISHQTGHTDRYRQALEQLRTAGHTYVCRCTRSQIKAVARTGIEGPVYPDTCRELDLQDNGRHAIRLRTDDSPVVFDDALFGKQTQRIHSDIGDFVIRRADGYFAYQLAVVVDDAISGITHVVRGADLLLSTARQIHLQRLLDLPSLSYLHVPLVLGSDGRKLSKSDKAHPVDTDKPLSTLLDAWRFLGQQAPLECGMSLSDFLAWAIKRWNPQLMANQAQSVP